MQHMIPFAIVAVLLIVLASCLVFVGVCAALTVWDHLLRRRKLHRKIADPNPKTARHWYQEMAPSDLAKYRATRNIRISAYRR